jgi:hypothetical protein
MARWHIGSPNAERNYSMPWRFQLKPNKPTQEEEERAAFARENRAKWPNNSTQPTVGEQTHKPAVEGYEDHVSYIRCTCGQEFHSMPGKGLDNYRSFDQHCKQGNASPTPIPIGEQAEGIVTCKWCGTSADAQVCPECFATLNETGVQILDPLTADEIADRLGEIHKYVQLQINDKWDWMSAAFYTEQLRTLSNMASPIPIPVGEQAEPFCLWCGDEPDHKCGDGHSCGTCCAIWGGLTLEDPHAYSWLSERVRPRIVAALAEVERLKREVSNAEEN